jgi:carbamoyl-phosphate synthase large subunit
MDTIRILLTGVGCPGALTVIDALRHNGERPVYIIGTDMRAEAAGRWFVDEFYQVPAGTDSHYAQVMTDLAEWSRADAVFPQLSYEVQALACNAGQFDCPVMVADSDTIYLCANKYRTYRALPDIPQPQYRLCDSLQDFMLAVCELGYPDQPVCFKPLESKGTRGFHILNAAQDRPKAFLQARPGQGFAPSLFEAVGLLGEMKHFPQLMVMEVLQGPEYTVDVFCDKGEILMGFVKTRRAMRAGLAMEFEMADEPRLWEYAQAIAKQLNLSTFANIQFNGGKLLEINPRISTMLIHGKFNMPWLAVKYTLGLAKAQELKAASKGLPPGLASVRYFNQIFYERS